MLCLLACLLTYLLASYDVICCCFCFFFSYNFFFLTFSLRFSLTHAQICDTHHHCLIEYASNPAHHCQSLHHKLTIYLSLVPLLACSQSLKRTRVNLIYSFSFSFTVILETFVLTFIEMSSLLCAAVLLLSHCSHYFSSRETQLVM